MGIASSECTNLYSIGGGSSMNNKKIFYAVFLLISQSVLALDGEQLGMLTSAVTEMCETPTKTGEKFSVEGTAEGGAILKLLKIGIEGKISKSEWNGIEQYREGLPDRVECVVKLVSILTPTFEKSSPIKPKPKPKCSVPWEWDTSMRTCVKKVTISRKNYAVPLDRPITKVDGRIDFYLNTQRLEGTDGKGSAMYKASRGAIQVVVPIMQGNTMVGDMREVIYSTSEGGICNISGLTETTGWMKTMRVSYIILLPDCGQVDNTCHARLDSSRKRVQIGMEPLTVTISKSC